MPDTTHNAPPPAGQPGCATAAARIRRAAGQLAAVSETPRLDAELLYAHAAGLSRSRLLARLREAVPAPDFDAFVARRLAWEPIAYITGAWEFFSMRLHVEAPLLVPRPETEHLVERALAFLSAPGAPPGPVLDLCTGTGCVAVALARHAGGRRVTATDVNPCATAVAAGNARRHHVPLTVRTGDLFAALEAGDGPFAAVVSNPPYVAEGEWASLPPVIRAHEDPAALLAGPDGLGVLRRIVREAPAHLVPGGLLAVELAGEQADAVRDQMAHRGFVAPDVTRDLGGHPRIVAGTWPG